MAEVVSDPDASERPGRSAFRPRGFRYTAPMPAAPPRPHPAGCLARRPQERAEHRPARSPDRRPAVRGPAGEAPQRLDAHCAGVPMTPAEFDAADDYDENFRYELIRGILVVSPIPSRPHEKVIDRLGYRLQKYELEHPNGSAIDETLPGRYVLVPDGTRRLADRVVWCGLGREIDEATDVPTIAVEVVSPSRRDRVRDYEAKVEDYAAAGVTEYWTLDRQDPRLTVVTADGERVFAATDTYETPLLPGFSLPVGALFAPADRLAAAAAEARGDRGGPPTA